MSTSLQTDEPETSDGSDASDFWSKLLMIGFIGVPALWFLLAMVVLPTRSWWSARDWTALPCTITDSELVTVRGDDGPAYRANIIYKYRVGEQTYFGERISHWDDGQTLGSGKSAVALLEKYPPQKRATCYVDPSDPTSAVLSQEFHRSTFGVLAGVLVALFFCLVIAVARAQTPRADARPQQFLVPQVAPDGTQVLRGQSDLSRSFCFFMGAFALAWNGFVVRETLQLWGPQGLTGDAVFFIVLFGGMGLLWSGIALDMAGDAFNARPILKAPRQPIRVGQSSRFTLELRGGKTRIEMLVVTLEGREEATYSQGTDTTTETQTFYFEMLCQTDQTQTPARFEVCIAPTLMHSLETPHNKIIWTLRLRASVARWRDIEDEWILRVEPMRI